LVLEHSHKFSFLNAFLGTKRTLNFAYSANRRFC
jgi:hypothetical protein